MLGETEQEAQQRIQFEQACIDEDARWQQQRRAGPGAEIILLPFLIFFMFFGMFDALVLRHFRADPTVTPPAHELTEEGQQ